MPFLMPIERFPMSEPVKRGPGRPRKQPVPAEPAEVTPDTVAAATVAADEPAEQSDDERIGLEVSPGTEEVSFGDGARYSCEDGKTVERIH